LWLSSLGPFGLLIYVDLLFVHFAFDTQIIYTKTRGTHSKTGAL